MKFLSTVFVVCCLTGCQQGETSIRRDPKSVARELDLEKARQAAMLDVEAKQKEASLKRAQRDAAVQRQAEELIEKCLTNGVMTKVERPNIVPHYKDVDVYVGKPFYNLSFEIKQGLAQAAWAKFQSDETSRVLLYDGRSGEQIGEFRLRVGLKMKSGHQFGE